MLGQSHAHLELLVAPVGEAAAAVAERAASYDDARVRLLPERPTWGAALDHAVSWGRGRHLTFLRGCDTLPDDALRILASSRMVSGSSLATGRIEQRGVPDPWRQRAQRRSHARPGRGVTPADRPELAAGLGLGGVLLDRAAWQGAGLRLDGEQDWLLSPGLARFLAGVERVDVLDRPTYLWSPDHGTRAFGATPNPLPALADWTARTRRITEVLTGTPLGDGWQHHLAGEELPRFLVEVERATDEQWSELTSLARAYDDRPELVAGLDVTARSLLRLAALGRRVDLVDLVAELVGLGDDLPTRVESGEVFVQWRSVGLVAADRLLTGAETPLRAHVARVRRDADPWQVDLFVAVEHVDLAPETDVAVHDQDGSRLEVAPLPPAEATRWAARRFQCAVAVRVDVPAAVTALRVDVSLGALHRTGSVMIPAVPVTVPDGSVRVTDVAIAASALEVTASGDLDALRLLDPAEVEIAAPPRTAGGLAQLDLVTDRFGRVLPLASGGHRLVTTSGNVTVADELRDRLPLDLLGEQHRIRLHLGPRGGLVLGIGAPLADDELGPRSQERLRAAYTLDERPVDPRHIHLETYAGRSATDSPLAIFHELRRRRPDLRTTWGIADHGQWVPEGAEPVLLRSRAWYDVLARAGCLVLNTDVEPWFRRRPDQFLLQTFHGYPSKAMGAAQWSALELTPSRVAQFRARGVDTWSAILTPDPSMTRHYREQYGYTGPAFERGYPRNDDLVGDGAEQRRARTRRLLGIEEHQQAILYAPTWREHLAVRARGAEMTDFLDVARAAREWGDDHVLLLRGHRFHAPVGEDPHLVDVTAYPEINDLVLASDAAVLDYSSLRFDYAITGKPMVFLVPDLAEYNAGSRSFLFPFEESAPGPFVEDTAGVVRELRDLAGLRSRFADEVAAFNATYNRWHDGRAAERVVDQLLAVL
ncbi:CDP-glycerol glycerophosphotransferase family protein [Nocardioides sp.]|uniref:CDP-glycerol glycerophosphotransferase family protein n=1 Tax=Nocardioides sp. TaxID=35761 RepID=UPI003563A209